MSFLFPYYFFGLLALLMPLLIHLWNRPKPKRIAFGSIQLLAQTAAPKKRRIQLWNWPLLLLRCLLLSLLVLFLSKPYWLISETIKPHDRLYFVAPYLLQEPISPQVTAFLDTIDSTAVQKLHRSLGQQENSTGDFTQQSYWSMAKSLETAHPGTELHLLLDKNSVHFAGDKPCLEERVKLHFADEVNSRVATQEESVALKAAKWISDPKVYYSKNRKPDLRYVRAALQAAAKTEKLQLSLEEISLETVKEFESAQLCIVLNEQAVPDQLLERCAILLSDAQGELEAVNELGRPQIASSQNAYAVKQLDKNPIAGEAIQVLTDGRLLLSMSKTEDSKLFQYRSRFNAQSNDWLLQSAFPAFLLELLFARDQNWKSGVNIMLTEQQAQPCRKANSVFEAGLSQQKQQYPWLIWIPLCLLLIFERMLSRGQTQTNEQNQ